MDWRQSNLGINDLDHYKTLYKKTKDRNPTGGDETFRATVGRFAGPGESKAIDSLLKELGGGESKGKASSWLTGWKKKA